MTHSPTPWWLDITPNGDRAEICYGEHHVHEDGWVDSPRVLAIKVLPTLADAQHIIHCVNLHAELVDQLESCIAELDHLYEHEYCTDHQIGFEPHAQSDRFCEFHRSTGP